MRPPPDAAERRLIAPASPPGAAGRPVVPPARVPERVMREAGRGLPDPPRGLRTGLGRASETGLEASKPASGGGSGGLETGLLGGSGRSETAVFGRAITSWPCHWSWREVPSWEASPGREASQPEACPGGLGRGVPGPPRTPKTGLLGGSWRRAWEAWKRPKKTALTLVPGGTPFWKGPRFYSTTETLMSRKRVFQGTPSFGLFRGPIPGLRAGLPGGARNPVSGGLGRVWGGSGAGPGAARARARRMIAR